MLKAIKLPIFGIVFLLLNACASAFSSYDSEFSCKNTDHGGCESPSIAYERAVQDEGIPLPARDQTSLDVVVANDKAANTIAYNGYKGEVYKELESLVAAPNTPLIAPARTVRTLILPYADPKQKQRLYMNRYIFSVVEEARFVLGDYLKNKTSAPFIDGLIVPNQDTSSRSQE